MQLDGTTALETAADVRELIGKVLIEVFNAPAAPATLYAKARTVGYLAGVLLKAFEVTEIERRISKLETKLLRG